MEQLLRNKLMDALYIISTQRLEYYHLVIILRSLLKYKTLTVIFSNLSESEASELAQQLQEIFELLGLRDQRPVVLYYDGNFENPKDFLEFIKNELGKVPEVLISENPQIYSKFYGIFLIDHLDETKERLRKLQE